MKTSEEHIIDASDQDENGFYEYYYEYDKYEFAFNKLTLIAKSYKDEDDEASFFASVVNGKREMVLNEHISSPEMEQAVRYLQAKGKNKFTVLTEQGYIPIVKRTGKTSFIKRLLGRE